MESQNQSDIYERVWYPKIEAVLLENTSHFFRDYLQYKTGNSLKIVNNNNTKELYHLFKNFVQTIIVLEKGKLVDRQMVYKYIGQQQSFDRNLPVPLNMPADKAERELIYRVLLELRSEVAQIKEFLMSQNPAARPAWGHPLPAWPVAAESGEHVPVQEITVVHEKEDPLPTLEQAERDLIRRALEKTNWNKRKAAKILNVSERTLYRKIKEYGLEKED